jgi:hypothetical protein
MGCSMGRHSKTKHRTRQVLPRGLVEMVDIRASHNHLLTPDATAAGHSIPAGIATLTTVMVSDPQDRALFLQTRPQGPSVTLSQADAVPPRRQLATAFRSTGLLVPGGHGRAPVIRDAHERLAELARLTRGRASPGMRLKDTNASTAEQAHYAQRLIATGQHWQHRAGETPKTIIEGHVLTTKELVFPAHTVEPDQEQ